MDWETPVMFEMVAVGAMAIVLELRMPCSRMAARTLSQSSVCERSMSAYSPPRSWASSAFVSIGRMPRSHLEPL